MEEKNINNLNHNIKVGTKVISKIYKDKGIGTVIGTSDFLGDNHFDVLFSTGEQIVSRIEDIELIHSPVSKIQNGILNNPNEFICRYLTLLIEANLTENALISSANYKIKPLPHQLLTVDFVMNRFQPRCLIADEVGLGKTIEAILVYQEYKLRGMAKRVIIIVPSGLVLQWHEELASKFNENFVIYDTNYVKTLKQSYGEETNVWKLNDKIIVSIDTIKPYRVNQDLSKDEIKRREWHNRHIFDDIVKSRFDVVIIDEAHKLSKKDDRVESLRFKLGRQLSQSVPIFLLLTATPHQGDEDLFLHLLQLIDPVLFANKNTLTPEFVSEVTVRNKKRAVVDFKGKRIFKHRITSIKQIERTEELNGDELKLYKLITEYSSKYYNIALRTNNNLLIMLVMLYQRIASSSSFAIETTMRRRLAYLNLLLKNEDNDVSNANEMDGINALVEDDEIDNIVNQSFALSKEDILSEIHIIMECINVAEVMTKTYGDQKFKELIEIIDEIKKRETNPSLKFIVFTEFRPTQQAIIEYLNKFGYSSAYINGSLTREKRVEQVELFRNEKQILVSTDAGGEGINLQFCHCIINFDLPWNPTKLEHRIGRIDRIGQEHNALVFNFQLSNTIEDRVREILERKLQLIKKQFGEDKLSDIIDVLQEEFSFEKIYVDAIHKKEAESEALNKYAQDIFNRAKEIIQKDDLLIPFTNLDAETAQELVNQNINNILQELVFSYLKTIKVEINEYKTEKGLFYFDNPFDVENDMRQYRNITFDPELSFKSDRYTLINYEHPLLLNIKKSINQNANFGIVSALKCSINKFSGVKGYWFIFNLKVTNNIDKNNISVFSIFMEDFEFHNNRISNYLNKRRPANVEIVQNYKCDVNIDIIYQAALSEAKLKANDMFLSKKLEWISDIEKYEKRAEEYFQYKEKAIKNIRVDNIRESRRKTNAIQREKEIDLLNKKKIVVAELHLEQVAYVEFI